MFAVIFICGNVFLRIAGKIAKNAKFRATKMSCHTVSLTWGAYHLHKAPGWKSYA